jgi:hypothetical protein
MRRSRAKAQISWASSYILFFSASLIIGERHRMREILRKQIREKDAMIDDLLAKLNPASSMCTPLSINPSRLALTAEQRSRYRDVLMYLDKGQNTGKASGEAVRQKIDVSLLDEEYDYESESEACSSGIDELQESTSSLHIHPLPAKRAPAGVLASAALETRSLSRASSPAPGGEPASSESSFQDELTEGGIANLSYFQPGAFDLLLGVDNRLAHDGKLYN